MTWIQTYTGLKFDYENPTPEMVCIEDIAHALARICRFTGHVPSFYCPLPNERVLTEDLRWVPSGDLRVGDRLIGFDEHPIELGGAGKKRRRFRPSVVTHVEPVKRRIIRLELSDGSTITASAEHPWLSATKVSRNQRWLSAETIAASIADGHKRYLHRFLEPWKTNTSWRDGWLAGMADGEGYFSSANRRGVQLGISQKPGVVLEAIEQCLREHGYDYSGMRTGRAGTISLQIRGGWREILRFMGEVRPMRLLDKFTVRFAAGEIAKQMDGKAYPQVVKTYEEGKRWVVGLSTSTHTYLCEGFGAHNSVAQHSVLLSEQIQEPHKFVGLMHDAQEAYVGDMAAPLKRMVGDAYRDIEDDAWRAVSLSFGLPFDLPKEVKIADLRMLATEKAMLDPEPQDWALNVEPYDMVIEPWDPEEAEANFLHRFHTLRIVQQQAIARWP